MANELLQEVACPNCQNPIDVREHGRHVVCDACNSRFILQGRLCPNCNTYHSPAQPFCGACGTAMERVCRHCNTNNWAGDEYCSQCGKAMDIFELLALLHKDTRREYLARRHRQIRSLRKREDEASRKRMAELEALAAAYQQEQQRRLALRQAEEKQVLKVALGAVSIFIFLVLAYTMITLIAP